LREAWTKDLSAREVAFHTGLNAPYSDLKNGNGTGFASAIPVGRIPPHLHLECEAVLRDMLKVKDTLRATVNLTFDGRAIKAYHGPDAEKRFTNEVRILRYLEARGCGFVPRLIEADPAQLRIVTTSCGTRVEHLDAERARELFVELETFGVRHEDPDVRNVTYRQSDGRFCLVDFEFATILPGFGPIPPP
jgi:hypothetical protein